MVQLIYLDEQEGKIDGRKFTAVCGFELPNNQLNIFRSRYYPKLNKIVARANGVTPENDESAIFAAPIIHGSSLLPDFENEVKFQILDLLFECLSDTDCHFFRLGYYDDSLDKAYYHKFGRADRIELCLNSFWLMLGQNVGSDYLFIYEIDRESLKKAFKAIDDDIGRLYSTGIVILIV